MYPYPSIDTFLHSIKYFNPADVGRMALVCKSFNSFLESSKIWKVLSQLNGVPYVHDEQAHAREHFRRLFPMTISSRTIKYYYGIEIGAIPTISKKLFELLAHEDPDGDGAIFQTHVFVVGPAHLSRVSLSEMNASLYQRGYRFFHTEECALAPSLDATSSDKVELYLIRKAYALQFMERKDYCLTEEGSQIVPPRIRALYLSIQIFETPGKPRCPDCGGQFTSFGLGWGGTGRLRLR